MDIEAFDQLYPSPAHAAAAERRGRQALVVVDRQDRRLQGGRLGRDRSGVVVVAAALAASVIGVIAYVSSPVDRPLPVPVAHPHAAAVPVPASIPAVWHPRRVVPVAIDRVPPPPPPARTAVAPVTTVAEAPRHTPSRKGSSRWILDPLSGDELAAALIIDKQRTVALNAEQLRLAATTHPASPPPATTIVQPGAR